MNKKYKLIIVIIIISIVVLIIGYKMLFMPYFMKNSKEIPPTHSLTHSHTRAHTRASL